MKLNKLLKLTDEEVYVKVTIDKDVPDCFKTLYEGEIKNLPESSVARDLEVMHFEPADNELKIKVSVDYATLVIDIANKLRG